MGHGWVEGSGSRRLIGIGLKLTESLPTGSVTHPWSPKYRAVRLTPFGSVMCTALAVRSITGLPSLLRSAYGAVKNPTFSAAKSGSRPVMKMAEHMILAKPDAWCASGSPGGGTYGVLSSSALARARRWSSGETGDWGVAGPAASSSTIATGNTRLMLTSVNANRPNV